MNVYIMKGENVGGEIEFRFNTLGYLQYFDVRLLDYNLDQLNWFFTNMPKHESDIGKLEVQKNINITLIPPDMSFDAFWDTYDYKVGNKARCLKLWNEIRGSDRMDIFRHLPKYEFYLKCKQNLDKAYPTTFLNEKRWQNVLPIKKYL